MTGSTQSRATADLLLTTLRQAGFEDAHFEEYALDSRWERGGATGRVVGPVDRPLAVGSYAWVPGTSGEVTAPLVDLGAPPGNELSIPADRLRGAAVMVDPHAVEGAPLQVMRAALARALAGAGATAMLIPSDKPNRMLFTSAFGFYPKGPLPVLSVAREDALFLRRLLASGPVRLALNVANSLDPRPARERNVVADIKGTMPGETVLLGAHFDSWDPGQGAQDDGVGVAAILEVARILKSLGIKPLRTIRFVFFSGEEQALLGSRAYVETHARELDGLRAVLIMDAGAQTPRGFSIQGRSDIEAATRSLLAPLSPLGASGLTLEADFTMDHAPFLAAGIPVSHALGRRRRVRHSPSRGVGHLRQGRPANAGPRHGGDGRRGLPTGGRTGAAGSAFVRHGGDSTAREARPRVASSHGLPARWPLIYIWACATALSTIHSSGRGWKSSSRFALAFDTPRT